MMKRLNDLSPTAYSDNEKKDLPLPAITPMANAITKYAEIAVRAMCHFSIRYFTPYPKIKKL